MQVFARVMKDNTYDDVAVPQDLGIIILHKGQVFRIKEDNAGRLSLSTDTQLAIKPRASNEIHIEVSK